MQELRAARSFGIRLTHRFGRARMSVLSCSEPRLIIRAVDVRALRKLLRQTVVFVPAAVPKRARIVVQQFHARQPH
jgi:hypothetical protein